MVPGTAALLLFVLGKVALVLRFDIHLIVVKRQAASVGVLNMVIVAKRVVVGKAGECVICTSGGIVSNVTGASILVDRSRQFLRRHDPGVFNSALLSLLLSVDARFSVLINLGHRG